MTTQNNGSMTALEAGLEAVLFAAGDAVTIERLSAALEAAPAELLSVTPAGPPSPLTLLRPGLILLYYKQ